MTASPLQRGLFVLILLLYGVVGTLYAALIPPWQAPDEPAHYNVIAQIAETGQYPVIAAGDWDNAYLELIKANQFAPSLLGDLSDIQYEDHQPPLYYVLLTPLYALTGGNLLVLRLATLAIGSVTVIFAYFIGRQMFPAQPQLALAAMALVALLPQHVHILASVNNDALAGAVVAVGLWWIVRYVRNQRAPLWALGIIIGVGLLTKTTTYFLVAVALLAIWLRWFLESDDRRTLPRLLRNGAIVVVVALLVGGGWWLRNISVYGWPDFLGLAAHDAVVVGQLRTETLVEDIGSFAYLNRAVRTTMRSYWGQFGWMAVPLEGRIYLGIQAMLVLAAAGLVLRLGIRGMRAPVTEGADAPNDTVTQGELWIVMGATLLLSILAFIYYNTEFVQFQGRYMYPSLIPLALALALGVDSWRAWLLGFWDGSRWLTVLPFLALAAINVYMLVVHVVPLLTPQMV